VLRPLIKFGVQIGNKLKLQDQNSRLLDA
jgi:hypothetical protein